MIYNEYREKLVDFVKTFKFDDDLSLFQLIDLLLEAKEMTWRRYYLAEGYKDEIDVGYILYNIENVQYTRRLLKSFIAHQKSGCDDRYDKSWDVWEEIGFMINEHIWNWFT